jgi:hypothetical protein
MMRRRRVAGDPTRSPAEGKSGYSLIERMPRATRRQALAAAGALAVAGIGGNWGRFAFGQTFESHVADLLGIDPDTTTELLRAMRRRTHDYEARAAGFLAVTTVPGSLVSPRALKEHAIPAFVNPLMGGNIGPHRSVEVAAGGAYFDFPLVYAGLRERIRQGGCDGLVRS